jgi:DNA-binding beta-propeller fold protein YncE
MRLTFLSGFAAPGLVALIASGACTDEQGAVGPAGNSEESTDASVLVTVAVSDEVLRLDPETGAILARIRLDPRPSESDEPHGVVISPDGHHWYATLAHGEPTLSKFERSGDRLVGRGQLGSAGAARVELDRQGQIAYVADYDRSSPGANGEVLAVRTRDLEVVARNRVCAGPHHALPDPATGRVAVACSLGDEVVILGGSGLEEVRRFPVDPSPGEPGAPRFKPLNLAWSPDGRRLYVALHLADQVRVFEPDGSLIGEIDTGRRPAQLALSADGSVLVSANRGDGTVSVIDTDTLREDYRPDVGAAHPHGIALDGAAATAFVTCEGTTSGQGRTVALRLSPGEPGIAWSMETGPFPLGVAWAPPRTP